MFDAIQVHTPIIKVLQGLLEFLRRLQEFNEQVMLILANPIPQQESFVLEHSRYKLCG